MCFDIMSAETCRYPTLSNGAGGVDASPAAGAAASRRAQLTSSGRGASHSQERVWRRLLDHGRSDAPRRKA